MVPNRWKQTTLDKVLTIGGGKDYKHLEEGSIPVYGSGGYMLSVSDYLYDGESVCIGRKGTIDKPIFLKGKFWTVDTLFYTHSFKDSEPYYIYQFFQTVPWRRLNEASGVPSLSKSIINKIKINLPPLPEQRKIAKILSTWDKAISTTERLIDNSKQQKKALMQQLLTGKKRLLDEAGKPFEGEWETAMLSDIGKVSIGLVTTMTKYYVDDGIPLIRNSDIKPNTINKTKMLQLCSDFSSDYDNRKLRKGDIVTVHTGEVGVSSVIDDELDGCIGFATLNTRPNTSKVNAEYLSWYFNSERFINWCVSMSTGDGRQNLNLKDFVKAKVLLPSLEEQQKIVSVLKNADKEIDVLVQQLADFKQEKKALMQQLLTGKRRVTI
ncbi:restriction endonuclease subunit S [Thalassotalea piscium]|uniref:Type I restriction enzyme S subunit n=1 Tax=Thalassotalea piscium TaxID=1230533 RepID=A0A7X0NK42_9GAMM|nr:restriction endonuclease subunit S [Thalassotalea piscium]MBB6544776.1 type I restriction enzyme S subunit [Thalassotalea piscium]